MQEMLDYLQQSSVILSSSDRLLEELEKIAEKLRNIDTWESLEIQSTDRNETWDRPEISCFDDNNPLESEEREWIDFLRREFLSVLAQSIETVIESWLAKLEKSSWYASLAGKFLPGLELYYCQGMSVSEIVSELEMTNKDRTKRILNLKGSIDKVKFLTEQKLLDRILIKAQKMGLATNPPEINYLNNLLEYVENFVKTEFYSEATAELFASKKSQKKSLYAEQIALYLKKNTRSKKVNKYV